jgi:ABC-type dipeptide/oligopeptide/nickel transport system ATPase subunit
MEIQDILKWTDEQLLIKTGKHLDSLQKAILEGVWSHQDYKEIALNHQRSYAHVKKEAWKLWKLLSDMIGEDIKQANVRSILERKAISTIYNYGKSSQIVTSNINSHINICPENRPYPEDTKPASPSPPNTPQNKNQTPIIDLTNAPALTEYYPRTTEETTLKNWILKTNARLITIYGLSGIGKSTLTLQLIQEIQTEFDYIIWQSLNDKPTLTTLQTNLKQIFSQPQKTPLPTILDYFRTYRCLIILDDLQNIFKPHEIAGQYLPQYEDYHNFFKQIATTTHQSCLILLTSEKPREIIALEGEKQPAKKLHLKGLREQAKEILKQQQLKDKEKWSELISLYQTHPTWLNIISSTINELFNGSVSQFLAEFNDIYLGDIEPVLETQLHRLSPSEKTIMGWLANQTKPVHISQTLTETTLSKSQYWQAIQSLIRRSIVEIEQVEEKAIFQINPIFKQYIQSQSNFI